MLRREVIVGSAALLLLPARPASAAEVKDFDAKAFAAAQEAGQGIFVHVNAPW
jgi:hypothetical protein